MKKIITGLIISLVSVCGIMLPAGAASSVCPEGTLHAGSSMELAKCNIEEDDSLMSTVSIIINIIIGIVGIISVIMIIVGGIQYATSQGDAQKVKKAKDTILYSVVGLVVAILAFAIVNFVLGNVFK